MEQSISTRKTKYCVSIEKILSDLGHATNAEILKHLRLEYPGLSATTVHRATSRLASRGEIGIGPKAKDGSIRYDANVQPHDHFQCIDCGRVRDVTVSDEMRDKLNETLGGCKISGRIVINGSCDRCMDL